MVRRMRDNAVSVLGPDQRSVEWYASGKVPAIIDRAGGQARKRFLEFFTATIRNENTRMAYARAVGTFFEWCRVYRLELIDIEPIHVAAYIERHPGSPPTVKQHLAAVRMLFDSFARVSAAVSLRAEDYYQDGKRWWFRFREKGGKQHQVPTHHSAETYLDNYLFVARIGEEKKTPLFQSITRHGFLTGRQMTRNDALRMVKRRTLAAGLPETTCNHTFRATGITAYLSNGGTIENAQAIAAHESPRTTKLYDRTSDEITLDEIERILI
jgi:integrase